MAVDGFSNAYETTLNGAINNSTTSIVVTSDTGKPSSVPFRIRVLAEGANTTEIMTVTAVVGTTYTVTRASEAYAGVQSASAHASGAVVEHVLTAGGLMTLVAAGGGIGARVYNSSSISVTTTALTFNSERFDTHGFHDTGSDTGRLTIPTALDGIYAINATAEWAASATGFRQLGIRLNGSTFIGIDRIEAVSASGEETRQTVSTIYELAAGNYVEVVASQFSGGGALNINTGGNYSPEFSIMRIDSGNQQPGMVLLEQHTASASSSLNFTSCISATYDQYLIEGVGIIPTTTAQSLALQMGTGGGPTWDTANNYYGHISGGGNVGNIHAAYNTNSIVLAQTVPNAGVGAHGFCDFSIRLSHPQNSAIGKGIYGTAYYHDGSQAAIATVGGTWNSTSVATAFRILFGAGTIASGTVRVYGIAK